jgi:hypothetical protein
MPDDLKPLFESFTEGPTFVNKVSEGIGPGLLSRPGPEGWSIRDVLVHLCDAELVRAVRMRMVLAADEPTLFTFDEGDWKRRLHYLWRSPEGALSLFQQTRFGNAELLRQCDRASWARVGIHPEAGRQSLGDLLRIAVEHDTAHVAQISTLRATP